MNDGIEGVIFDAVGTLIEPTPPVAEVYVNAARRQGMEFEAAEVRRRFKAFFSVDYIGDLETSEVDERLRWQRIVEGCLPELPDQSLAFEELWAHFGNPNSWKVFPDVVPAIAILRDAGVQLAIASNFDARLRSIVVGTKELSDWAKSLTISSEVGHRKPHPKFYEAARQQIKLPAESILFVGDEIENDFLGPTRAGFRAILVDREGREKGSTPSLVTLAQEIVAKKFP